MVAVPKKYKKQIKNAMAGHREKEKIMKPKMTWSFKPGDLIDFDGVMGIITSEHGTDGYFRVFSPSGNKICHAKTLKRVQRPEKGKNES